MIRRFAAALVVVDADWQLRGMMDQASTTSMFVAHSDGSDAPACYLDYSQDCRETGHCCSETMRCFEKNAYWSACMPFCIPGQQQDSDKDTNQQGPWSCREVLPADEFLVREAAKSLSRSKEEIKRIYYDEFKRFDEDKSFTLNLDEFRRMLQEHFAAKYGFKVSEDLVQRIWSDVDQSAKGAVNLAAFCKWKLDSRNAMSSWSTLAPTAKELGRSTEEIVTLYYDKYKTLDADQSGSVELKEFQTLLGRVLGREVSPHVLETLWKDLDSDGSGFGSFKEFAEWYFQWMDTQGSALDEPLSSDVFHRSIFNHFDYDRFPNKRCTGASFALSDRTLHPSSAKACMEMCSRDPRCDLVEYLTSPGRCEKRHFYEDITKDDDALSRDIFFKDAQGTNLYVKLSPAADPPAFEWKAIIGILAPSSGKILEKDTPAMSFGSCRDLCARSRFCNCFAFSNVSSICDRYFNCQSSQVVPDSRYKVYYKVGPLHEDSEPWALKWIVMVLLLSCVCFLLGVCFRRRKKEGRAYAPLTTEPELEIMLENSSKVERWPGSCGNCGCACGRPPFWIPSSGAVVVLPVQKGSSPKYSSMKRHPRSGIEDVVCSEALKPADVILRIGDVFIRNVQSMEQVIKSARSGDRLDMIVLRPREAAEYSPASRHDKAEGAIQELDVLKALKTHEEVKIQLRIP